MSHKRALITYLVRVWVFLKSSLDMLVKRINLCPTRKCHKLK